MEILLPPTTITDKMFLCKNPSSSQTLNQLPTKPQFSRSSKLPPTNKTQSNSTISTKIGPSNELYSRSSSIKTLTQFGFSKKMGIGAKNSSGLLLDSSIKPQDRTRLLVEEESVDITVLALNQMKYIWVMHPSSEIYRLIIYSFVKSDRFEDALFHLKVMEDNEMKPHASICSGLIKSYAKNGLYDEMAKCVKRMESNGCFPNQSTYNLLIREFSLAGLIKRMERAYRIVISKKMDLEASTVMAMLEAYASFGDLEKMEKIYRTVMRLKPRVYLNDDLIHKVTAVYIENYMFNNLDDMGIRLYSRTDNMNIVWCLRILSHACLLSRTGM
ncbi:putative tetratricopeptide-like helical domain superfamily [Helianthus anomalus]